MAGTSEPTVDRKPKSTPEGIAVLDDLVAELGEHDVVRSAMFGMPSLKVGSGKAFAGMFGDELVVKLDGAAHAAAIALPGATLFDPSGSRPMKQWVQLPVAHRDRWLEFVRLACEGMA